jgi:hypothetical protein
MYAIRLYMLGPLAQKWLEEAIAYFVAILAKDEDLSLIRRNAERPGEGVLELPDEMVEFYNKIAAEQVRNNDHLQGGCGCMARKYGFSDGHMSVLRNPAGVVTSVSLIIQA